MAGAAIKGLRLGRGDRALDLEDDISGTTERRRSLLSLTHAEMARRVELADERADMAQRDARAAQDARYETEEEKYTYKMSLYRVMEVQISTLREMESSIRRREAGPERMRMARFAVDVFVMTMNSTQWFREDRDRDFFLDALQSWAAPSFWRLCKMCAYLPRGGEVLTLYNAGKPQIRMMQDVNPYTGEYDFDNEAELWEWEEYESIFHYDPEKEMFGVGKSHTVSFFKSEIVGDRLL